jgi:hypothetical protein
MSNYTNGVAVQRSRITAGMSFLDFAKYLSQRISALRSLRANSYRDLHTCKTGTNRYRRTSRWRDLSDLWDGIPSPQRHDLQLSAFARSLTDSSLRVSALAMARTDMALPASWQDITHYQRIVKILAEADPIMKEIELRSIEDYSSAAISSICTLLPTRAAAR